MKISVIPLLLALLLLHKVTCTHLETCDCHEIRALVNATVEEAIDRLGYKLSLEINTVITKINTTDATNLSHLENNLITTMERLLKPIQTQLDYHLPPPPPQLPPTSLPPAAPTSPMATRLNFSGNNPAESCKAVYDMYPDAPSGYYWVGHPNQPYRVYCKMDSTCGNLTGGWMRVAYLDMRNSSHQCPSRLTQLTHNSNPRRLCGIPHSGGTCVSVKTFHTYGMSYSHVHGKIIAYQNGYPLAFRYGNDGYLNGPYVYGVSLTRGLYVRKHIWTFAAATDETSNNPRYKCPCINSNINSSISIPNFVGKDYFCDTGLSNHYNSYNKTLYPNDPLWDGQGCGPTNTCCTVSSECNDSPPWFIKHLPSPTNDPIEMRLCQSASDGSTPIEIVELYIQ